MQRRAFLYQSAVALATATRPLTDGEKLAKAARSQLGVTTGYDPRYDPRYVRRKCAETTAFAIGDR